MEGRALALLLGVCACSTTNVFPCTDDSDCDRGGEEGVCATPGYCAFEDVRCESGLRFGGYADPELADDCVEAAGSTDGTGATPGSEGSASASSTTATPLSSATEAPTGPPETATEPTVATEPESSTSSSSGSPACPTDWWDCSWSQRRWISIAYEGESLDGFPAQLVLDPTEFDFSAASEDGADIRFVFGETVAPHERVVWEPRATTELWVQIPTLGAAGGFYLYYGNRDAVQASDPVAVWSNAYFAVLHFVDETDALGSLDLMGTSVAAAPGLWGNGLLFDGVGSYLQDQSEPRDLFADGATISVVFNAESYGESGFGRLIDGSDINTTETGYSLAIGRDGDGITESLRFGRGHTIERGTWGSAPSSVQLQTWTDVAMSYSDATGSAPRFWVDGATSMTTVSAEPEGEPVPAPRPSTIGALGDTSIRFFDGVIDELHIAISERSDAWIRAEHLSFTNQLLSVGSEQSLGAR